VTDRDDGPAAFTKRLTVKPGSAVDLDRDYDPADTGGITKLRGRELLEARQAALAELQARLAAQDTHAVLVILQGIDASGKDGTIRHVLGGVNPQGVRVHSFKVPSAEELSHDFLWRYQQRLPSRGELGVFNRSHYEEVLVVRVHPENLDREHMPVQAKGEDVWMRRYREINDWERYLVDNGVRLVKLCLNLSKEEQRLRLLRRCELPDHNWKFSLSDVQEREHWDEYRRAFSEMLYHTSTPWAPWQVIPADRKWFARLAVASVIVDALTRLDPQYPTLDAPARERLAAAKAELTAQAPVLAMSPRRAGAPARRSG
jgi:PPK2 family polyphosphate:nucleotide phosphotransferase